MESSPGRQPAVRRLVLCAAALSGAAALVYEVVWTRQLSLIIGSSTYALSTVLGSFMTGLAAGAWIGGRAMRRWEPLRLLFLLEVLIACTGLLMPMAIAALPAAYAPLHYALGHVAPLYLGVQFLVVLLIMLVPTTLMGATFPVALKGLAPGSDRVAEEGGGLYAVNTAGSVAGAVGAGFLLVPNLGLQYTNFVAVSLNFLAAAILAGSRRRLLGVLAGYLAAGAVVFSVSLPTFFFNVYQAGRYRSYRDYLAREKERELVYERKDVEGPVHIFRSRAYNFYTVYIRGRPEGTTNFEDDPHQLLMTYLPLAIHPEARRFLKIGLGPGVTLWAAARVPTLEEIDGVDLNGGVIEAVRTFLQPALAADPRVRLVRADARRYLAETPATYDIITAQSSDPTDDSASHLFTREYYRLVRSRLSEGGIFAQFIPSYLLEDRGTRIVIKTLAMEFPYVYGWEIAGQIFVIASSTPTRPTVPEILRRVDVYWPGLAAKAESKADPAEIVQMSARADIPVNTDDRPIVEFITALNVAKYRRYGETGR